MTPHDPPIPSGAPTLSPSPDEAEEESPYCATCGACGECGCCPPTQCKYLKAYEGDYASLIEENNTVRKELAAARKANEGMRKVVTLAANPYRDAHDALMPWKEELVRIARDALVSASAQLTRLSEVPMGGWFYIDIGGKPGLAITQKRWARGGSSGNQHVVIGDEYVWWVKSPSPSPQLSAAPAVEGNAELVEARKPRRQMEIVGPDGTVHYRRPEGHPMIAEALGTPGYTVRPEFPATGAEGAATRGEEGT